MRHILKRAATLVTVFILGIGFGAPTWAYQTTFTSTGKKIEVTSPYLPMVKVWESRTAMTGRDSLWNGCYLDFVRPAGLAKAVTVDCMKAVFFGNRELFPKQPSQESHYYLMKGKSYFFPTTEGMVLPAKAGTPEPAIAATEASELQAAFEDWASKVESTMLTPEQVIALVKETFPKITVAPTESMTRGEVERLVTAGLENLGVPTAEVVEQIRENRATMADIAAHLAGIELRLDAVEADVGQLKTDVAVADAKATDAATTAGKSLWWALGAAILALLALVGTIIVFLTQKDLQKKIGDQTEAFTRMSDLVASAQAAAMTAKTTADTADDKAGQAMEAADTAKAYSRTTRRYARGIREELNAATQEERVNITYLNPEVVEAMLQEPGKESFLHFTVAGEEFWLKATATEAGQLKLVGILDQTQAIKAMSLNRVIARAWSDGRLTGVMAPARPTSAAA